MKFSFPKFQLMLVLALAAVSAGVATLITWSLTPLFYFEVSMQSSTGGMAQVFYDVGRGICEADSLRLQLREPRATAVYRFPLPQGNYQAMRFDPLDHGNAHIVINYARIVDISGHTVRNFPVQEVTVSSGVSHSEIRDGRLNLTLGPTDNDSILSLPGKPITLQATRFAYCVFALQTFLLYFVPLTLVGILCPILARRFWSSRTQQRWSRFTAWVDLHPGRTLLIVAAVSTTISCYPVVFFGKSFVSPNNGTLLLYDRLPTLPGYTSSAADDAAGADVGAAAWFHIPYAMVESRALFHDFELPLWNRYDSCGVTLLGQGQSMFGDPLHFLVLFTGGSALAWDVKFLLAKMLFAWGVGLTVFAATRHLPSSLILTASSVFLGFFAFRYDHAAIFSVCYSPWILYCWFRIREVSILRKAVPWVVGLILANWTEMNSGTVKEAYVLLLGMNGCGFLIFLLANEPFSLKLKKLSHVVMGGLVFLAISMPVWLTFLDALRTAHTLYNSPGVWNIQPNLLLGFFDDMFYRQFISGEGEVNPSTNFLILLGFLFALGHFGNLRRDPTYRAVGISTAIALAMAFAMVPVSVIARIPFVGRIIHIGNTFSCVLIIYSIVMAGFGLREFWSRLPNKESRGNVTVPFLFLALLLWFYVGFFQSSSPAGPALYGHDVSMSTFFYWYASSLLVAVIALPFIARGIVRSPRTRIVMIPILLVCVFILHWRHGMYLTTPVDKYVMNPQERPPFGAYSPAINLVTTNTAEPFRTVGMGDNLFPGFNSALGVESFNGAEPLANPFYRQLTEAWHVEKAWDWRLVVTEKNLADVKPLTNMLNIRYFLGSSNQASEEGLQLINHSDMNVYQSDSAWPRAFFVDGVSSYDTLPQFVRLIRESNGHPFAAVETSETFVSRQLASLPKRQSDLPALPAFDYKLTTNTTSFKITAPTAGVVALTENYLPDDFRVTVNGKRSPYFRVNHAFKGIALDRPGTYLITVSYWPHHFTLSLLIATGGLFLLALYVFAFGFRSGKTMTTTS
jgi:hypothetical protein